LACQSRFDVYISRIACNDAIPMPIGMDDDIDEVGIVERGCGSLERFIIEGPGSNFASRVRFRVLASLTTLERERVRCAPLDSESVSPRFRKFADAGTLRAGAGSRGQSVRRIVSVLFPSAKHLALKVRTIIAFLRSSRNDHKRWCRRNCTPLRILWNLREVVSVENQDHGESGDPDRCQD
jgi:hypothetical protein